MMLLPALAEHPEDFGVSAAHWTTQLKWAQPIEQGLPDTSTKLEYACESKSRISFQLSSNFFDASVFLAVQSSNNTKLSACIYKTLKLNFIIWTTNHSTKKTLSTSF